MTAERRQGLLYLAVGAGNTVFGLSLFAVMQLALGGTLHYLVILTASWIVGVLEAFVAYRVIVFEVVGHVLRDLARFSSVYVGAFAFNLAALPFGVDVLGAPVIAAQSVVTAVTVVTSYVLHRRFSFRRDPDAPVNPAP